MRKIFFIVATFISCQAFAQDIQFSQFHQYPLLLNPAMAGFFEGDYRVAGIYRNQYASVSTNYTTYGVAADVGFFKRRKFNHYLGVGLNIWRDQAGDLKLANNDLTFTVAYAKKWGYRTHHLLGAGFQFSSVFGNLKLDNAVYPDGIDEQGLLKANSSYTDMAAGIIYQLQPRKRLNMYLGVAGAHFNGANFSHQGDNQEVLFPRITISSGAVIEVGNNFNINPGFLFFEQGPSQQINTGANVQFILGEDYKSKTSLSVGLFGRFSQPSADALIPQARFDYKGLSTGLSYDINISELSRASRGRGAFEASVVYYGSLEKRFKNAQMICPRF